MTGTPVDSAESRGDRNKMLRDSHRDVKKIRKRRRILLSCYYFIYLFIMKFVLKVQYKKTDHAVPPVAKKETASNVFRISFP